MKMMNKKSAVIAVFFVFCSYSCLKCSGWAIGSEPVAVSSTAPFGQKQLHAIRGEVVEVASKSKGIVAMAIRPSPDYSEVTVIAGENQLVGGAIGHEPRSDLFGVLAGGGSTASEPITAAELQAGDVISVIYDPLAQNKALEIYLH